METSGKRTPRGLRDVLWGDHNDECIRAHHQPDCPSIATIVTMSVAIETISVATETARVIRSEERRVGKECM